MEKPDFASRMGKLKILMEKKRLDACLLNSRNDIFYYTGESIGDFSSLLVSSGKPCIFLTSLNNYVQKTSAFAVVWVRGIADIAKRLSRFKRTGFDEYTTSFWAFSELKKSKCSLVPFASQIKQPRMIKDEFELEHIGKASKIASKTLSNLGDLSGKTEMQVSDSIENAFRSSYSKPSFETIVASGKNSSHVHHINSSRTIGKKDLVVIDAGAVIDSYCSDISRTLCSLPGKREKQIIENVKETQCELIDMISEGVKYDDIQRKFENLMRKKRYKVLHSFGHGIGLSVHERPSKGDTLKEGMAITVEPGAYIKNFGGCRIEDIAIVRKGRAKILSS